MTGTIKCYRVWMLDYYAGLYNAESAEEAKQKAVEWAKKSIEGAAMDARDKKRAVTVNHVECLD